MARAPDPHRLVTVHVGPPWEVELLVMRLDDAGIPAFQPDSMTKTVDPFITGANPLGTRLQVRAADAERAMEILEEAQAHSKAAVREQDEHDDEDEDAEDEGEEREQTPEEEVEWLATRTRWSAVIQLTFPFAILFGWFYMRACRAYGCRSGHHRLTLVAFAYGVFLLAALLTGLVLLGIHLTATG